MRTQRRSAVIWTLAAVAVVAVIAGLTRLAASVTTAAGVSCGSTWHVRSSGGSIFGGARSATQAGGDAQACLAASDGHWHAFVLFAVVAVVAVLVAMLVGVVSRRR